MVKIKMFFESQSEKEKKQYKNLLKMIGSLSRLFSDSEIPYLYYRIAENIFCKVFSADNLARSNISLDVKKDNIGIGLKTFIKRDTGCIEKIAEFNKSRNLIDNIQDDLKKIELISRLRNDRLKIAGKICGIALENMLYHCILRTKGRLLICETSMLGIDLANIKIKSKDNNITRFCDGLGEYSYNASKSTLYERFNLQTVQEIEVNIYDNPYRILEDCFNSMPYIAESDSNLADMVAICLPLYSQKGGKHVPEKSGLNQWNAGGRARNANEVYIPIPAAVNKVFPEFFPPREQEFMLKIPSGSFLRAKICQDNNKALMTNPNSALGEWLLRDVLELQEKELLTYEKLEEVDIDSVEVVKFSDDNNYAINFKKLGTYENFKENRLESCDDTNDVDE